MKLWGKREEGLKKIFWWKTPFSQFPMPEQCKKHSEKKNNKNSFLMCLDFFVCARGRETETEAERERSSKVECPSEFPGYQWDYMMKNLK